MKYIIKAQKVVKRYHNHTALNKVSIKIPKGSIYGLLGPNGAGKTTFIRLINQISKPDKGEILFYNKPLSEEHIQKIGYLPEERGLYKKMKVGEQAMYLAQLKGMSKTEAQKKLHHWFDKFDILDWWNKKVEDLSKGMAQKIQFIVTVVHEPDLLILDEPFSGFDPINTELIKQEILELKERGTTIIFSTHNMQSVEEICDYITLINQSETVIEGPIEEIKKKFSKNTFDIHFIGNMITFTNALWTGFELLKKEEISKTEFKVTVCPTGQNSINELIKNIVQGCEIKSVYESSAKMHDIFIKAVAESNEPNDTMNKSNSNE
ncbi:MAG: ABC transporter ATP-binding protein [Flavobacteriales bacterium]|nr:ABC transporter ATP-binding protein [Flavobacteriales bacterium]